MAKSISNAANIAMDVTHSMVHLSHSYTVLKPTDRVRCDLAEILASDLE